MASLSSSSARDSASSSGSEGEAPVAVKLSDEDRIKQMWQKEEALTIEVPIPGLHIWSHVS